MKKNAEAFVLVIYGLLAICMIGCGSFGEDAAFVNADPPNDSDILPEHTITVTFDNTPMTVDVEIQGHPDTSFFWELDGKKLTVRGNPKFQVGQNYVIIITWATGRKILNYNVPGVPEPPPATFVSVSPGSGSEITGNGQITVIFDSNPGDVIASTGTVTGSGKTRLISGPFTPGPLVLVISWTNGDGNRTFAYTVVAP